MQLIYRGSSFIFQPAAIAPSKSAAIITRNLIYRGVSCVYRKPINETPISPKAINWRFSQVCQRSTRIAPAYG